MICQSNENAELEAHLVRQLASFKIDGLLISVSGQTKDKQCFDILKKKEVPMILFDRVIPDMEVTKIVVDGFYSSFLAVEHLIKSGRRCIAHLSGPSHLSISICRLNGYLAALKKHGIPANEKLIIPCENFEKDAPSAIRKLFCTKPYPDGIFAINDLSAVIVIQFLRKKGIRVPEDVAVIGFNDDPICEIIEPALSTVRLPCYEIGQRAVEMLVARINDNSVALETLTLKSKLIIRNSSALSRVKSNKPFAFSV